jgi:hypothetical protein
MTASVAPFFRFLDTYEDLLADEFAMQMVFEEGDRYYVTTPPTYSSTGPFSDPETAYRHLWALVQKERRGEEEAEIWEEARQHVATRLIGALRKPTLIHTLAEFRVALPARASKAEVAYALAEQLLYKTDSEAEDDAFGDEEGGAEVADEEADEDVEFVGETTWTERDARLRAEAVQLD